MASNFQQVISKILKKQMMFLYTFIIKDGIGLEILVLKIIKVLECLGVKDNQIKISGRRIEIGEIEFVLSKFKKLKTLLLFQLEIKER